jgi:hypothetical protein
MIGISMPSMPPRSHPPPGEVRVRAVDRGRDHGGAEPGELVRAVAECDQLGGADEGEVEGIEEEHQPAPSEVRERDLAQLPFSMAWLRKSGAGLRTRTVTIPPLPGARPSLLGAHVRLDQRRETQRRRQLDAELVAGQAACRLGAAHGALPAVDRKQLEGARGEPRRRQQRHARLGMPELEVQQLAWREVGVLRVFRRERAHLPGARVRDQHALARVVGRRRVRARAGGEIRHPHGPPRGRVRGASQAASDSSCRPRGRCCSGLAGRWLARRGGD